MVVTMFRVPTCAHAWKNKRVNHTRIISIVRTGTRHTGVYYMLIYILLEIYIGFSVSERVSKLAYI